MKILHINKYYFLKGGAERYMLDLMDIQKAAGHEVAIFAMEDERNLPTPWSAYFSEPLQTNSQYPHIPISQYLRSAVRFIYNREAQKKLADLLDTFKPDIIHLHNYYHQLSTSILCPIRQRNIPVVQTLHDYHLIDPTYKLFCNGQVCEPSPLASPRGPMAIGPWSKNITESWRLVANRCIQQSYLASALEAIESWYSRTRGGSWTTPDRFIAPSEFLRKKCIEFGVPSEKITTLNYTFRRIPSDSGQARMTTHDEATDYKLQANSSVLYVGRLDDTKGVDVLLRAFVKLPDLKLDIVGDGPGRKQLEQLTRNLHLTNVTFVGWKSKEEINEYYRHCAFIVVPSIWYEVFGLVILEAAQWKKTAIASSIGGIPEVLEHGKHGMLVPAGNVDALTQRMEWLATHPLEQQRMGENAYRELERFESEKHWERLKEIYDEIIQKKK